MWAAIGAFFLWGGFPLYLKPLSVLNPLEVMSQRIVWCCLFVSLWLWRRGELREVYRALSTPKNLLGLAATAILVSSNWLLFVWAVKNGRVLDGSLGYFINPLVNVLLGVLLLSERLNKAQWSAVALASAGVAYLWWQSGAFPIVALSLAFTFGGYGLIRKLISVPAVVGLAAETTLLTPFALATLWWLNTRGELGFGTTPFFTIWLFLSGIVTAVPLALFAMGARLIPYSTVGIIQYMAPTLQMLCGVLVFGEPFPQARVLGFAFIWSALIVYAADGLLRARKT